MSGDARTRSRSISGSGARRRDIARGRNIGAEALKNETEYPVDKRVSHTHARTRGRVSQTRSICYQKVHTRRLVRSRSATKRKTTIIIDDDSSFRKFRVMRSTYRRPRVRAKNLLMERESMSHQSSRSAGIIGRSSKIVFAYFSFSRCFSRLLLDDRGSQTKIRRALLTLVGEWRVRGWGWVGGGGAGITSDVATLIVNRERRRNVDSLVPPTIMRRRRVE